VAALAFDSDRLRFLELHETRVHARPGREVLDLGDVVVLHDPIDREPFWNRAAAIRWPTDARAFDRRLDATITLFATLDRVPHIWPRPALNEPPDLVDRLVAAGFEDHGGGLVMALDPTRLPAPGPMPPGAVLERIGRTGRVARPGIPRAAAAADVALVLAESFGVEADRRASIEAETLATLDDDAFEVYLVRADGQPAAVAKAATFDGATYLSSIGTRPSFRGRGLGGLATLAASRDALELGSSLVYLGVYTENRRARRLYERLGFVTVGEPAPDLLLR
jgi:ribosomal protein S18 acetylase RimI-like enzyme